MKAHIVFFQKLRLFGKAWSDSSIFITYIKCLFTFVFIVKLLGRARKSERIFGCTIYFFQYAAFLTMFEDIFIENIYAFESNKKSPSIVDCGTNIGLELIYYKMKYPSCTITCFEPDPDTFRLLKKTISTNGFAQIRAYNYALSETKGKRIFYKNIKDRGSLIMGFYTKHTSFKPTQIHTVLLSDYVDESVDFMKMDIEGAEGEVFRDLSKKKKLRYIREFIMEFHYDPQTNSFTEFLDLIHTWKFRTGFATDTRPPFEKNKPQNIYIHGYRVK